MAAHKQAAGGDHHLTPMQQVHAIWLQLLTKVDALMARHPQATLRDQLRSLEKQLNVPAAALFVAGASLSALVAVLVIGLEGLALLGGFAYPLVGTLRAVKVEEPVVMKFFLKYWVIYNFLNVAGDILPLNWIPFFPLIKLLLLLWAFNPKTQGATFIYGILRPFLLPPLGITPAPAPASAASGAASGKRKSSSSSSSSAAAAATSAAAAKAVVGDDDAKEGSGGGSSGSGGSKSFTLKVELAARGLEKPPEPERLDTLCQLRVVPAKGSDRKPALDEGQWYKTPTNTTAPEDEPDWRHDPQFITLPDMEDNVLEVIVINKMSWKDQPLGKVRLPLKSLALPVDTAIPLEDPNDEGVDVKGELEIHLSLAEE